MVHPLQSPSDVPVTGNLLLDRLSAATIVLAHKARDIHVSDHLPILTRTTEEHVQKLRYMISKLSLLAVESLFSLNKCVCLGATPPL